MVRGGHGCFPVRSLGQFALAQKNEHTEIGSHSLSSNCRAHGYRQPVPQRAGVLLDPRDFSCRMTDKMRLISAKRFEFFKWEKSPVRQHDIQCFNGMALTLDISVALRIAERLRRNLQYPVVQNV